MLKVTSQDAIMYVCTPFTSIPAHITRSCFLRNAYYKLQCSDCTDCIDCSFCSNCRNCKKSEQCSNMTNCTNCQNCSNMVNCTNCKNCSNLKVGVNKWSSLGHYTDRFERIGLGRCCQWVWIDILESKSFTKNISSIMRAPCYLHCVHERFHTVLWSIVVRQ